MQIKITRIIKKVGLFKKSIELEETLFLYTDVHDDDLFPLIHAIGVTVTDHPSQPDTRPRDKHNIPYNDNTEGYKKHLKAHAEILRKEIKVD